MTTAPGRPGVGELFRAGEFRALWTSYALSACGDRLALVAITLLVYDRTRSPLLSAIAFASGTIPYLFGGILFAGVGDRWPRRGVMVAADLLRAVLTAVMILPGMPLPALIGMLYLVGAAQPPFDAARAAAVRDILDARLYGLGATVMQVTFRAVLIVGAGVAGLTVAFTGPRIALAVDAVTFAVSAALIRIGTASRPAPAVPPSASAGGGSSRPRLAGVASGLRIVFGDPVLRTVMLMGWLAACYEVPEGIAAPYAASAGGGPVAAGLLIASGQAMVLTGTSYVRFPEAARRRWMGPMVIAAPLLLVLTVLRPGIAATMTILAAVSICGMYQITANTTFVAAVPADQRGLAFSVAATGLVAGQGIAFAVAGWAAQAVSPATVTAIAGAVGTLIAAALAVSWRRLYWGGPAPRHQRPRGVPARSGAMG